jgi:membrane fusion protein (multidrug efflux system)
MLIRAGNNHFPVTLQNAGMVSFPAGSIAESNRKVFYMNISHELTTLRDWTSVSLRNVQPVKMNHQRRLSLRAVSALCLVAMSPLFVMLSGCRGKAKVAPPPTAVEVVMAQQQDVSVNGDWIATLDGYVNAQIQPEVSGYLVQQLYHEGSYVHKGQVLFQIDPQTFQATLDLAKAQLAQAQAKLALAVINVKRDTPLAQQHAIAQSQLDSEVAEQRQDEAAVQSEQVTIRQAQINLNFTHVRSLTDGIAGMATTQVGNLVAPGTALTSVSKVDPIKVYFAISEQEYMRFAGGPQVTTNISGQKRSKDLDLQLDLADGTKYPHNGKVIFTDRQIDPQTGTIKLVAAFANPGNILRPGQFGRVHAATAVNRSAILVPQRCVTELQGTYQVAVVGAGNKVSVRNVKLGERVGRMQIIESGLNAGEQVISEGNAKVRDGMIVNPTAAKMEGNE